MKQVNEKTLAFDELELTILSAALDRMYYVYENAYAKHPEYSARSRMELWKRVQKTMVLAKKIWEAQNETTK